MTLFLQLESKKTEHIVWSIANLKEINRMHKILIIRNNHVSQSEIQFNFQTMKNVYFVAKKVQEQTINLEKRKCKNRLVIAMDTASSFYSQWTPYGLSIC